jgi:hypothetical protein
MGGGPIVTSPTASFSGSTNTATSVGQTLIGSANDDTFNFTFSFGNDTIAKTHPTNGAVQIDHSVFAGGAPIPNTIASPNEPTTAATSHNQTLTVTGSNDTFVFTPVLGNDTITKLQPTSDAIQIDHSVIANVQAVLPTAQDDGHGNVVITADTHDSITLQNITLTQLQTHQSDFHFT